MKYENKFKKREMYCISDSSLAQMFLEVYEWVDYDEVNLNHPILVKKRHEEEIQDGIYAVLHDDEYDRRTTWYLLTDMCNRDLIPEGVYVVTYPESKLLLP